MSIPGFTADKSLCKTEEVYERAAIAATVTASQRVVPAFCIGGMCCTCTDYGCVCQPKHGHVLM